MTTECDNPLWLWTGLYRERKSWFEPESVGSRYAAMSELFACDKGRLTASIGEDVVDDVADVRGWIEQAIRQVNARAATARAEVEFDQVSVWRKRGKQLLWYIEMNSTWQNRQSGAHQPYPSLHIGIDLSLARSEDAPEQLAQHFLEAELHAPAVRYGFVNPARWDHVRGPVFYNGMAAGFSGGATIEQLVEQFIWNYTQERPGDIVRGVHWGNLFGREMANALRGVGADAKLKHILEEHGGDGTVLMSPSGGMSVMLSRDPVRFARRRDGGESVLCPSYTSFSPEVMMIGTLKRLLASVSLM